MGTSKSVKIENNIKYKVITDAWGNKEWFQNDLALNKYVRHRELGPAVEYKDGGKEWWRNNQLHREDGPAVITKNSPHL